VHNEWLQTKQGLVIEMGNDCGTFLTQTPRGWDVWPSQKFAGQMTPAEPTRTDLERITADAVALRAVLQKPSPNRGGYPTTGSDPEIFLRSGTGALLPAWRFLPGKANPRRIDKTPYRFYSGTIFADGFQAEYTPETGFGCNEVLVSHIADGLNEILATARDLDPTATLSADSVVEIPPELMASAPPEFQMLGCDPSLNLYDMPGEPVTDGSKLLQRFAGGHVHLATAHPVRTRHDMVFALDAILSVWAVGAAANFDSPVRRRYYGRAGEFRLPTHGLEYRTLSNFWLRAPWLAHCVFDMARMCAMLGASKLWRLWQAEPLEVVETINHCDVKRAREILQRNHGMFVRTMGQASAVWTERHAEKAYNTGLYGLETVVRDPKAIATNWQLYGAHNLYCDQGRRLAWTICT